MKNKVLVLAVVFTLLTCSGPLVAKERRGAEVKILKNDKTVQRGELIAVKPASLLLLDSQSGTDVSVDIKDITTVTVMKKFSWNGFLIGTGASLLAAFAIGSSGGPSEGFMWSDEEAAGMLLMFASPLIGLATGGLMGSDRTIQIAGYSQEHIKADLEKLRKQARITNFQ
jgi:hypothetical protein